MRLTKLCSIFHTEEILQLFFVIQFTVHQAKTVLTGVSELVKFSALLNYASVFSAQLVCELVVLHSQ